MKKKVLSLCIPTYNRSWCIKEQIKRLKFCSKYIMDKIEIIISDNCSTDDSQKIIEDEIEKGFPCKYIRNKTNLGMDGNFVRCCCEANGRYIWILGDDDIIIINSLEYIINILDVPEDYGLLHIDQKNNDIIDVNYVDDYNYMIKRLGYHLTFISANIVNSKFVQLINYDKYYGTLFVLIPLYLTALKKSKINIIIKHNAFDGGKDSERGGYNFFKVFVENYLTILKEYILDKHLYRWLKKDIWKFVWIYTQKILINKEFKNFEIDNGKKILLKYYFLEWYFWYTIIKHFIISTRINFLNKYKQK